MAKCKKPSCTCFGQIMSLCKVLVLCSGNAELLLNCFLRIMPLLVKTFEKKKKARDFT